MKSNFKPTAIAAIAALVSVSLSSCTKSGDDNGSGRIDNDKPITVSLVLTEKAGSRAVAAPVNHDVAVTFKSGYVIFTNNLDIVNKVTEIVSGSYSDDQSAEKEAARSAGTKVWLDDMKIPGGGEIRNVPGSATMVYIAGNLPTDVAAPRPAENISDVKDRIIRVSSQRDAAGSVDSVTLYGNGTPLTDLPEVANAKYAQVDVKPVASRIEIGKISYSNSNTTPFVTGFRLDGIFINYYYPQMSLAGKVSTALVNNAPIDNTAADAMYSSPYTDAALFDYNESGIGYDAGSSVSWSAADSRQTGDKNVWAYNVLAPTSFDGTVTALAAPHIVIRLSNFTTTGDDTEGQYKTYSGTQYLTVKEFRKKGATEPLKSLEPGFVYFITELTFNESNLTNVPETQAVTAYVEAVLMTWQRQEVDWEF